MKQLAKDFATHASQGILRCLPSRNATKKTLRRRRGYQNLRQEGSVNREYADITAGANTTLSRFVAEVEKFRRLRTDLRCSLSYDVQKQIGIELYHIASDDDRFLRQSELPLFDNLTYTQAAHKIQLVNSALDILDVLKFRADSLGGHWNINEKVCANLEHLLLCIRHCLVRTFVHKAWDEACDSPEWRYHSRRQLKFGGDKWCAEFSNNQRPTSTTWPWSIRPSLAVLWGVCWMFYPSGNEAGQQRHNQQQFGWQPAFQFPQPALGGQHMPHPSPGT